MGDEGPDGSAATSTEPSAALVETHGCERWLSEQFALPREKRHVVTEWIGEARAIRRTGKRNADGAFMATGKVNAVLSFGYDLYCLQIVNKLPHSLVKRLQEPTKFQGARYEVAIASVFARANFEICLLDDSVKSEKKHCEFTAMHKITQTTVYVEAKSRVRPGVLGAPGHYDETGQLRGDIFSLYEKAVQQGPSDHPFFIFIDANHPTMGLSAPPDPSIGVPCETVPWMAEIEQRLEDDWAIEGRKPSRETAVFVTNYAPHYGASGEESPPGLLKPIISPIAANPIKDESILRDLFGCLQDRRIPREI
jgi:hypothetical protein